MMQAFLTSCFKWLLCKLTTLSLKRREQCLQAVESRKRWFAAILIGTNLKMLITITLNITLEKFLDH